MLINNKTWGINLSNKKMCYEPWPVNLQGKYCEPLKSEISEIYGISGEAINETLLYFEECGGDTQKLIKLLNNHVIDNRFYVDRESLLDKTRWYNNEYYFYFIMFTKKVLDDYNWHFMKEEDVQLSIHHKIYEMGFLRYIPYGDEEKDDSFTILYAIIKYYTARNYDFTSFFDWAEVLVKHKTSISFKNVVCKLENYWLCSEFINFLYEFVKITLNKNSITTICFEAFDLYDLEGFSYLPEYMLIKIINFMTVKGTNFYDVEIKQPKKNSAHFKLKVSKQYNKKKDYIYQTSIYHNANSLTIGAYPQIIKKVLKLNKMPQMKNLSGLDSDYCTFTLKWEKRILLIPYLQLLITNLLTISLLIMNNFFKWNMFYIIILFFLPFNAFLIILRLFKIEKNRRKLSEENVLKISEDNRKRLEKLEDLSNELMLEKQILEQKVEERTSKLAQVNEKLKELDKAKTNFFANISHELRTPLTLIISPLKELKKGSYGNSIEKNEYIINTMLKNANRLLKLINNILDFTKIEAGKMNINNEKIDISETLKTYVSLIESAVKKKNLYIKIDKNIPKIITLIDQNLFEIAIFNILSNALKFTTKGGITIKLKKSGSSHFIISIADTGIGIPEEKKDFIFDRFHQVDDGANRKYEGTGIGLALTKEIIELFNGKITVESKQGNVTKFEIILPINIKKEFDNKKMAKIKEISPVIFEEFKTEKEEQIDEIELKDRSKKTILIVEDNIDLQRYISSSLEKMYNLETAKNGNSALQKIKNSQKPSLIISDIMMPEMDGKEFYNKIQNIEEYKNIPFIFLTALVKEEEKIEGLKSGAIDYICKPFNIEELKLKVENIISENDRIKKSYKTEVHKKILNLLGDETEDPELKEIITGMKLKDYNLSKKEIKIAFLIAKGNETKEIADILKIKTHSVENHITNIYKKTGISNKIELFHLLNKTEY